MPSRPIQPPYFTGKCGFVTGGSEFIDTNLLMRLASEPGGIRNLDFKPPPVAALRASCHSCDIAKAAGSKCAASHLNLERGGISDGTT